MPVFVKGTGVFFEKKRDGCIVFPFPDDTTGVINSAEGGFRGMENNSKSNSRLEAFFSGKGFYIVLFACLAVIGVSAWTLLFSGRSAAEPADTGEATVAVMAETEPTVKTDYDLQETEPAAEKPAVTHVRNVPAAPAKEPEAPEKAEAPNEGEEEKPANAPEESGKLTYIWPISGTVAVPYSPDALLYSKTMADWRTHSGVDIAAQMGAKVMAAADGKVESVYDDDLLGTTVIIDHGGGVKSVYANLAATPTVKAGDAVTMGSVIGAVGDTALGETGEVSHLHFAVTKDGAPADPEALLPKR